MKIGTVSVEKGRRVSGRFETGDYRCSVRAAIPLIAVRGAEDGPTITVLACQHGRELNGIEGIRRAVGRIDPGALRGTAVFIPCANPVAARTRRQDFPYESGRFFRSAVSFNLNRVWPGKADGSLYEQMAHAMWEGAIARSQACIDLHGWTGRSSSLVWSDRHDLVRAFGLDIHSLLDPAGGSQGTPGMVENACRAAGIAAVTAELAPQCTITERSVEAGARGVMNVMKALKMLEGPLDLPPRQIELDASCVEHAFTADRTGLLVTPLEVPALVKKGDLIAQVADLDDVLSVQEVRSPIDGVLFNTGPVWCEEVREWSIVDAGETVALVKSVARVIENGASGRKG